MASTMATVAKRKIEELRSSPHAAAAAHSDTGDDSCTDEDDTGPYVSKTAQRAAKAVKKGNAGTIPSVFQQKVASSSSVPVAKAGPSSSSSASSVRPVKSSASSSASAAVSAFFTPKSQKQLVASNISWLTPLGPEESCLVGVYGEPFKWAIDKTAASSAASSSTVSSPSSSRPRMQRIAAFDLDDTLASAQKGKLAYNFRDENDWEVWGNEPARRSLVVEAVRAQSDAGALLVIVSNQKNLDLKKTRNPNDVGKVGPWKSRLRNIAHHFNRPFVVFAGLRDDRFRKPRTGWVEALRQMWRAAGGEEAVGPLDVELAAGAIDDNSRSFYVGDAAGREELRDHHDTDRKLAQNLGWRFFTPQAFFLKEQELKYKMEGYHPDAALLNPLSSLTLPPPTAVIPSPIPALLERLLSPSNPQTLLILVGPQASGKSHIARRLANSKAWTRVNRDTLGSQQKCLVTAAQALRAGKSVVIDNTSPTYAVRRSYLELLRGDPAVPVGVRKMAVHLDFPRHVVEHNEAFRVEHGESLAAPGEAMRAKLPESAFKTYYDTLQAPAMDGDEGWDEVVRVQQFEFEGSEELRRKWAQWYL